MGATAVLQLLALVVAADTTNYAIGWYSISRPSTGGGFSLLSRVEPPSWQPQTNGEYALTGGMGSYVDCTPTILACASDRTIVAGANHTADLPDLRPEIVANAPCGLLDVTQSPPAGTTVGTTTQTVVTITLLSPAGSLANCSATVTVMDCPATIIACPSDRTLSTGPACSATLPDLTSEVLCYGCGSVTVTQSPPAGITLAGPTQVVLAVWDESGNSNGCTATVTVATNCIPTIAVCASDLTFFADTNCMPLLPDLTAEVLAIAQCGCDALTVTQSPPPYTVLGLGQTEVTLSAFDDQGNSNGCVATVTVKECTPGIYTYQSSVTIVAGPDQMATLPDLTGGVLYCGCTVTQSPPAGTFVALGQTTVTFTVWDGQGNSNGCSATVTVEDMPRLRVALQAGSAQLSWPVTITPYELLENSVCSSYGWLLSTANVSLVVTQYQAIVAPATGARFFRLRTP